ncbi:MAG TPA: hypothetical protein VFJ52_06520 [Terriglobia bacterium]|nr:hypothetical protein [Terriglobia bacterium]
MKQNLILAVVIADCYLSTDDHAHEHALRAKTCLPHGGSIVFLGSNGATYLALPPKDAAHYSLQVLKDLGKPGVTVQG